MQKIDVLIGALLENDGTGPGQLVAHIVKEQFDRIRRGDRFYFENINGYVLYLPKQSLNILNLDISVKNKSNVLNQSNFRI